MNSTLLHAAESMQGALHGVDRSFDGVSTDTRTLQSGELFIALSGPNFDGGVSFSSGHTATAFSIATIIANEYGNQPLVPPLSYSLAFLAGWSRMNDNKHWASDVIFGAAIGYFTAKAILKYHKGRNPNRLVIMPMMGKDRRGATAYYQF